MFEIIRNSKKPAVGHNMSLDLAFSLAAFARPLPPAWPEYKLLAAEWCALRCHVPSCVQDNHGNSLHCHLGVVPHRCCASTSSWYGGLMWARQCGASVSRTLLPSTSAAHNESLCILRSRSASGAGSRTCTTRSCWRATCRPYSRATPRWDRCTESSLVVTRDSRRAPVAVRNSRGGTCVGLNDSRRSVSFWGQAVSGSCCTQHAACLSQNHLLTAPFRCSVQRIEIDRLVALEVGPA